MTGVTRVTRMLVYRVKMLDRNKEVTEVTYFIPDEATDKDIVKHVNKFNRNMRYSFPFDDTNEVKLEYLRDGRLTF